MCANHSKVMKKKRFKQLPKCGRCKNHGLDVLVRDHKKYCIHQSCLCELCLLTVQRRDELAMLKYVRQIQDTYVEQANRSKNFSRSFHQSVVEVESDCGVYNTTPLESFEKAFGKNRNLVPIVTSTSPQNNENTSGDYNYQNDESSSI
ncbi:unnamed protein product [Diamesa serratosioi]